MRRDLTQFRCGSPPEQQHPAGKKVLRQRILMALLSLFLIPILASCETARKKPPVKKQRPAERRPFPPEEERKKPPPEIVRTNAKPSTADAATPKRTASLRLVESGKGALAAGNAERAASLFRDAINIDGSNGIAFYYLAEAELTLSSAASLALSQKTISKDEVLGLLDKAEALLGSDTMWMEKIEKLRMEVGASPSRPVVGSPIDQAF